MSNKKIEQTKTNKFFRPLDILVYGIVLLIIVVLLVIFVFRADAVSLHDDGAVAEIFSNGSSVFLFDFGSGEYVVVDDNVEISASASNEVIVTVYADAGMSDYNVIVFDMAVGGKVWSTDANCSSRHDCTYMEILNSGGSIVCIPHHLLVNIKSAVAPPISG